MLAGKKAVLYSIGVPGGQGSFSAHHLSCATGYVSHHISVTLGFLAGLHCWPSELTKELTEPMMPLYRPTTWTLNHSSLYWLRNLLHIKLGQLYAQDNLELHERA
jgi:hypothetical protein